MFRTEPFTIKISYAVVVICCLVLLPACSKVVREDRVLENGQRIVVSKDREGAVTGIELLNESLSTTLIVKIDLKGLSTERVQFFGPDGTMVDETTFKSDRVSSSTGPVYFENKWESSSEGRA